MTRESSPSIELLRVLHLLNEVQQASDSAAKEPPADKPPAVPPKSATDPNELFAAVHVEGEDRLARVAGEEKVEILRRKVRALEDRLRDIRKVWAVISKSTEREKRLREGAEGRVRRLNTFLHEKKKDFEEYQVRVQAALQDLASREQQAVEEHARREREVLNEHSRHEREALEDQEQRERDLRDRAERAERRVAELQRAAAKPAPAPLLTPSDIARVARSVDATGRGISDILQGRVDDADGVNILRKALKRLKAIHKRLAGVSGGTR